MIVANASGLGPTTRFTSNFHTSSFQYTYDPYGLAVLQQTSGGNGVGQNPYSFKSGVQDRTTGFVKFGQRWYNPAAGTWTQQDTLDAPLDAANANRYAYAGDDPINNIDPTGTKSAEDVILGCLTGAGIGVIAGLVGADETGVGLVLAALSGCASSLAGDIVDDLTDSDVGTDIDEANTLLDLASELA